MITYGTKHLTLDGFKEAYDNAALGEMIVYAVGDLAASRSLQPVLCKEINRVGKHVMQLSVDGLIHLTQRVLPDQLFRSGPGRSFEYRATKCQSKTSTLKRLPLNSLLADALATV